MKRKTKTYAGIPDKYGKLKDAAIALIPAPFDGTSTWGKGADKGPEAFLEASENMELYDIKTNTEVYKKGIFLAPAIKEKTDPAKMVDEVYTATKKYLDLGKFTTIFGGEHSISIGTIRAFAEKFENLTVVQFDAHTDLRPEYHGTPYNHACALYEASTKLNLIHVGIRSMDVEEVQYLNREKTYFAHEIWQNDDWMKKALKQMSDNVFITIDLDVFESSLMPSTGTPEPGGMPWYQLMTFVEKIIKKKNVVGFDIVELAATEANRAPDFLAAKLYYRMLSEIFAKKEIKK
jgi:agmatinase